MDIIPYSRQEVSDEDIAAVSNVLRSDFLTQGPQVENFEHALCNLIGAEHAIACSSGTAALHLAYSGLGAGKDSLAIVPAITFSATANAMLYTGGEVAFCDVDPVTGIICTESLSKVIKMLQGNDLKKLNFITPVSLSGSSAPLDECARIGETHGYHLIEDASHSILSSGNGENGQLFNSASCEYTDAACLSFHPVKHLCCGEGGAVMTNSADLADRIKSLRSHGIIRPNSPEHSTPWLYEQVELGWNYRLTDMQAALGTSQISRIQLQVERRKLIAAKYDEELRKAPFLGNLSPPLFDEGHSWHLYVVHLADSRTRDELHKHLRSKGILTQVHYVPLYKHPYFERKMGQMKLPGAEQYYKGCLSIPLFPGMTGSQQERVIEEMAKFFN